MIWFAHNESVPIFAIFQLCPQILQKLGYKPLCCFNWNVLNIEWNNLNYENTVWNSELRNEPLLLQAFCNKWEGTAFDLRCASNRFNWLHDAIGSHSTLKVHFAKRLNYVSAPAAFLISSQLFSYFLSATGSQKTWLSMKQTCH